MPEIGKIDYPTEAITPYGVHSVGGILLAIFASTVSGASWPSANRALFIPFRLREQVTITQIVVGCGVTGGGNFDVGIYDMFGNRIVSSGSTARVASSEVVCNITDTTLGRGMYYMAMSADSTGTIVSIAPGSVSMLKFTGMKEMASAFPLPSTATFATLSSAYMQSMALYRTSL